MKCTACFWPLCYDGGENKNDYSCSNPNKLEHCPAWTEAHFYPWMSVRDNWWFAAAYALPFKWNNKWYCIRGPQISSFGGLIGYGNETTFLQELTPKMSRSYNYVYETSSHNTILQIPYRALPVNDDFMGEFNKLVDQIMNKYLLLVD
jgi:hypothetical protein